MIETAILDARIVEIETGKVILSASRTRILSYGCTPYKFNDKDLQKKTDKFTKMNFNVHDQGLSFVSSMAAEKICALLAGEYPEVSSVIKPRNVD